MQKQADLIQKILAKDRFKVILLDACRYDYFKKNYEDFNLTGDLNRIESAGRDTFEYMKKCFPGSHTLTYISGVVPINSLSDTSGIGSDESLYGGYSPSQHISNIIDVWNFGWKDELGTVPPVNVTDVALKRETDRMFIQYHQPHAPFIGDYQILGGTGSDYGKNRGNPPDSPIWNQANRGLISRAEIEKAYESNLRLVLEETQRLINKLSDTENLVITSDHGELLGEDGKFAHPRIDHPKLREIPWFEYE